MLRLASLLLVTAMALSSNPASAQTVGVVPQPAEGTKAPPPPGPQPGPVTGSAADAPAVSGQADGQPVVTPHQQAAAPSPAPDTPNASYSPPSPDVLQATAGPNHATMPESPTFKTPEPSRF